MTSKGIRASCLSKYTEADASYSAGLTTKTFIGYSLCYRPFLLIFKSIYYEQKTRNIKTIIGEKRTAIKRQI